VVLVASVSSSSETSKEGRGWLPAFRTVTGTVVAWPTSTQGGASMLSTAASVNGSVAPPSSIETPKRSSTRSIRLTMVSVSLPANSRPTG
jgi:hypothetical protein